MSIGINIFVRYKQSIMKKIMIIAAMAIALTVNGQGWIEENYNVLNAQIEKVDGKTIITERDAIVTPQEQFHLVIIIEGDSISFYDSKRMLPYQDERTRQIKKDFNKWLQ